MSVLQIGPHDGLFYEYAPPVDDHQTFVFVNALTGNTGAWQAEIAPALREQGFGTLCYNLRGQADSPFDPGLKLHAELIVADLGVLLRQVAPPRALLCGLSVGGLYAARAALDGAAAEGLILLNTLRRPGPRLDWINTALLHAVAAGGIDLLLDLYLPLLVGPEWLAANRASFLKRLDYHPLGHEHGHYRLIEGAVETDWNLPWERLALPTLVITGHQDRMFLDLDEVDELFARLPDARREDWPDAGHLLTLECPRRVAEALARFAAAG